VAHHDTSLRERVIAVVQKRGLPSVLRWSEWCLEIRDKSLATNRPAYGQVGGRRGTGPAEDAVLIYEAQTDLFVSACELEAATYVYFETSAGLTARHAVVEDDGQWSSHIF
jgi:hypothetical protein